MKQKNTVRLVQLALLTAVIFILANTPLGYIKLPLLQATTIHIPVIIGAVLLGPKAGAFLGGVFGLTSLISNTMAPTLTSFLTSPFISGTPLSLIICFVPRILVGVVAAYVFRALFQSLQKEGVALLAAGFLGSLTNTVLYLLGVFLFFGQQYAQAQGVAYETLVRVLMSIVGINGVPEAIAAALLVFAVAKPLRRGMRRQK